MKRILLGTGLCLLLIGMTTPTYGAAHRIGGGLHYWAVLDEFEVDGIKDDGMAILGSYQYQAADFFKVEAALEFSKKGFSDDAYQVISPIAYFLVGRALYAGAGAGMNYADGEFGDPFFAVRAGLDLELLPTIFADLNATYRFEQWGPELLDKHDLDADLFTIGATIRIEVGE